MLFVNMSLRRQSEEPENQVNEAESTRHYRGKDYLEEFGWPVLRPVDSERFDRVVTLPRLA